MLDCSYSTNMAAFSLAAVRTLNGVLLVPGRWLLTQSGQTPAVCRTCRLHVSPAASLCSSRTEPPRSSSQTPRPEDSRAGEEEPEGPEYIPRRKAKNPMIKIGYAWMIGLPTGIIGFFLAKRQVDKNRLQQLKIRQRMKRSNEGDYEGSRYNVPSNFP
ncbi:DUF4748 domain-containing protein [Amphiprion ocellaris]|uniref:Uncharacterized protein n=1 Tax=Amphiprion ocellaris TaxID=80972 RepID=A0A3Q1CEK1_AMPOC|nr:DUF4748 domain-containing protein [Amphiprion ocellaris]